MSRIVFDSAIADRLEVAYAARDILRRRELVYAALQPQPGQPVRTIRTLTGIDASGDGGLLDLAVSPSFPEDGLIYAYLTTATDNRVVSFTLTGPLTPVLTGIPKGPTDNTGRLLFDQTGMLYVGTGDAGQPALAESATSLAGKVLTLPDDVVVLPGHGEQTTIGRERATNPFLAELAR